MNENLADEIRQQIEKCKELKLDIGDINNHLSTLEGLVRKDITERVDEAYKKGFEDGKAQDSHGCEGCEWDGTPFDVCSKCRNSYGNLYKRKESDDDIKVGDKVVWTENEDVVIVVTFVYTVDGIEWCDGVCRDGKVYQILTEHARKTGRHFDIPKILEEMKE